MCRMVLWTCEFTEPRCLCRYNHGKFPRFPEQECTCALFTTCGLFTHKHRPQRFCWRYTNCFPRLIQHDGLVFHSFRCFNWQAHDKIQLVRRVIPPHVGRDIAQGRECFQKKRKVGREEGRGRKREYKEKERKGVRKKERKKNKKEQGKKDTKQ